MNKLFRRKLQVLVWVITMMLSVLLFRTYTDEAAQVQENEIPEVEAALPSLAEERQQSEGTNAADESAVPKTEIPTAEPSPAPTPTPEPTRMPMFDIIDGKTIYLSITEEEFIEIAEFLRAGLSVNDAALAGILANLQGESGFNPHKIGDGGEAYGICQWQGPRLDQMVKYCEENSLSPVSLEGQLSFLVYDLINNYIYAYDQIRLCEDSESGALQATYNFCAYYEVPADPGAESVEREEWAKLLIYPKLNELSKTD